MTQFQTPSSSDEYSDAPDNYRTVSDGMANQDTESQSLTFGSGDIRRPVDILTRENHEQWFPRLQNFLIGKGIWWAIESNVEGRKGFEQANGMACYLIDICTGEDDEALLANHPGSARTQWNALKRKYEDKRPMTIRTRFQEFYNFQMQADETIAGAHTKLLCMARKIKHLVPDSASLMSNKWVFQQLLSALPKVYAAVRDTIDAGGIREGEEIDDAIRRLQEKEDELRRDKAEPVEEVTQVARRDTRGKGSKLRRKEKRSSDRNESRRRGPRRRRDSDRSDSQSSLTRDKSSRREKRSSDRSHMNRPRRRANSDSDQCSQ
jgi:gag-polypeptide of LTR copia-type